MAEETKAKETKEKEKEKTSAKVPGATPAEVSVEVGLAGHTLSKKISLLLIYYLPH